MYGLARCARTLAFSYLLGFTFWSLVNTFDSERVCAEFTAQKAYEQSVQVPADRRARVDDAGTLGRVKIVGRVETNIRLAV